MKIELYNWQEKALIAWKNNNYKGIISATTGSGKTIIAIKAIEILAKQDPDLKIIIVVPSIALLNQWKDNLEKSLEPMSKKIGLSGSKHSDKLIENEIMLYVVNSAVKFLADELSNVNSNVFLIADECHRYGSVEYSAILKNKYAYTLGLSATPERESDYGFEEYLEPNLGKIIFKYNYADAIQDGVISPFKIINYGLNLFGPENEKYRAISEQIKNLRKQIEARYPASLANRDRYIAEIRKHEGNDPDVKKFLDLSVERKRILYRSQARLECVLELIKEYHEHKIMIFHEEVESLNILANKLEEMGYSYAMVHYKKRRGDIDQFKKNNIQIFLSAKMFSEGVDLPDVDVGIIAAASSSVRQKIQTVGRIIRKHAGKKEAYIINIFIRDTTDERVFSKMDWTLVLGTDIMESYTWPEKKLLKLKKIENKKFRSTEEEANRIEIGKLLPEELYTAKLEGDKFSFDANWKLFKKTGGKREYFKDQESLSALVEMIKKIKPEAGSFFINKENHVIVKDKNHNLIFAGIFNLGKINF